MYVALTRARRTLVLHRRAVVRREHQREGGRASSSASWRSGCSESHDADVRPRGRHRRGDQPAARATASGSCRTGRSPRGPTTRTTCSPRAGAERPPMRSTAGAVQPTLLDAAARRGSRAVRGARGRAPASRRRSCWNARARRTTGWGAPVRPATTLVDDVARHVCAVPEALLLDHGATAASVPRSRRAHRHRDPQVDRANVERPDVAARRRRHARTSPTTSSSGSPVARSGCARATSRAASRDRRPCSSSGRSCCGSAGSRSTDASTRSTGTTRRVRGRSSTGRPARAKDDPTAAGPVRLRVRRDLRQATGRLDTHLCLPVDGRRGLASDGRSGCGSRARRGSLAIHRRRRVRPDTGPAMHLLRLPGVLRGRQGVAGERRRRRRYVVSRSICASNVR